MDRKLFLFCQSFLYPLSSSSVSSEHGASQNDSSSKCCQEVLLDGMNLSVEPCEDTSFCNDMSNNSVDITKNKLEQHSIGPAYFLSQKVTTKNAGVDTKMSGTDSGDGSAYVKRNDPTFCKVELILYTSTLPVKGMTTPVKKANTRDLSEIDDQVERNDEAILIANIDGDHFQIDLNRLLSTSVGQSGDKISTFLILEMPSCCFRVFSSKLSVNEGDNILGIGDSSLGTDHDKTKFDSVQNRLKNLLSGNFLLPFPLSYSGQIIPSEQISEPNDSQKLPAKNNNHHPLAISRRCLHSYYQSWNNLIMFDKVLENPHLADSVGSTSEKTFKETVNGLMSKIPKHVSLSFIEEDHLTKAVEIYENKIATKIDEFDGVIEDFWNEKSEERSNNKRRRDDVDSDNDCPRRYADILRDHKKYIISKHELLLLPLRG